MKTVASVTAALLAVIGIGVGLEAATAKPLSSRIDQVAMRAAAAAGDPHPLSVTWVEHDQPAYTGIWLGLFPPLPGGLAYILEVRGNFALDSGNVALDGPTPLRPSSGPVLWLFVSAATLATVREDAQSSWDPLTVDGQPETDSLVGLSPTAGG